MGIKKKSSPNQVAVLYSDFLGPAQIITVISFTSVQKTMANSTFHVLSDQLRPVAKTSKNA